jgi:hypothetical protein
VSSSTDKRNILGLISSRLHRPAHRVRKSPRVVDSSVGGNIREVLCDKQNCARLRNNHVSFSPWHPWSILPPIDVSGGYGQVAPQKKIKKNLADTGLRQSLVFCTIYNVRPCKEKERDCKLKFYISSPQTTGRDSRIGTVKWMLLYGMFWRNRLRKWTLHTVRSKRNLLPSVRICSTDRETWRT